MVKQIEYILGLDLGETSIGWSVIECKKGMPARVEKIGVRIYDDGRDSKSKEPLSVTRRIARGARRRRDRYIHRRLRLMDKLVEYGLMPQNEKERKELEKLDPYELRAKALYEKLTPYELGRALFHINQRRGFKSNRKTDTKEAEAGAMSAGIEALRRKMAEKGAKTLGEYLYKINGNEKNTQKHLPLRMRSTVEKSKASYDMYPERAMYEDEVKQIFAVQGLDKKIADDLFDTIFFQRPLRPQEIGLCEFEWAGGEKRAYRAYPAFQKFRALQQINQLKVVADNEQRFLTLEEKEKLIPYLLSDFSKLNKSKKLSWTAVKTILGLNKKLKFNLESERRDGLDPDVTSLLLSAPEAFGTEWFAFGEDKQNEIITLFLSVNTNEELADKLIEKYGLSDEKAKHISTISLPPDTGSLSLKAIAKLMPFIEKGDLYNEAVEKAGYTFSRSSKHLPEKYDIFINPNTGETYEELPYYGQVLPQFVMGGEKKKEFGGFPEKFYGKINNPTVHIVLNQVRKLVNELVKTYGHPSKIVVELSRDLKLGKKKKDQLKKEQDKNHKDNKRIADELERLGIRNSYNNRMKYKLWEDSSPDVTKRCCPFCGEQISFNKIFDAAFEIEHLIPFSRSYLDSRSNKVLSCRRCNSQKGDRTPYEAFASDQGRWNQILARVENLPENKQWKFKEDAMKLFSEDEEEGMLARMMTDTQYMSRIAKMYLSCAANPSQVFAIPGRLTEKLRHHWGLDSVVDSDGKKDRTNHRHHAIDAFIVACTNRETLRRYGTEKYSHSHPDEKAPHLPYPAFRLGEIQDMYDNMIISHKPDHGNPRSAARNNRTVARLHEDTYYGMRGEGEKKGTYRLVTRTSVKEFKTKADLDRLVDQKGTADPIRLRLEGKDKSEHEELIAAYFTERGMRRARIFKERSKEVIQPFYDKNGKPYRYAVYGSNAYAEVFCPDRGKNAGKWQVEIIPNYRAHQKNDLPNWRREHARAKLIMRLHINDMVAYEKDGKTIISRVKKMTNGLIYLRPHEIAYEEADKLSWGASGEQLRLNNGRKIKVDLLGRVFDPQKPKASE